MDSCGPCGNAKMVDHVINEDPRFGGHMAGCRENRVNGHEGRALPFGQYAAKTTVSKIRRRMKMR